MSTEDQSPQRTAPQFTTARIVELEEQVSRSREELAATLDQLVARASPAFQARRAVDNGRQLLQDARDPHALPEDRARARTVLAAAAGLLVVVAFVTVRKLRG